MRSGSFLPICILKDWITFNASKVSFIRGDMNTHSAVVYWGSRPTIALMTPKVTRTCKQKSTGSWVNSPKPRIQPHITCSNQLVVASIAAHSLNQRGPAMDEIMYHVRIEHHILVLVTSQNKPWKRNIHRWFSWIWSWQILLSHTHANSGSTPHMCCIFVVILVYAF